MPRLQTTESASPRKATRPFPTVAASPDSPNASQQAAANSRRNPCLEVGSVCALACHFSTVRTRPPDRYRGQKLYARMSGHDHCVLLAEDQAMVRGALFRQVHNTL